MPLAGPVSRQPKGSDQEYGRKHVQSPEVPIRGVPPRGFRFGQCVDRRRRAYGSEYIMPECARCRRTADIGIGRRLVLSALAPLLPLALGRWRWLLRTR